MSSNSKSVDRYIYQLPYAHHQELCRILDRDMKWEELGGKYMNFDMNTIIDLRRDDQRGRSPTSQLLTMWGQQNHTVVQLFVLLSKMHHYQAMTVLKPLVDSKYHDLIHEGEENVSVLFDKKENLRQHEQYSTNGSENAGAVPHPHSSVDNNMNVWGDNLNHRDVPRDLCQNKMLLSPEQPERKISNKPMPLATNQNDSNKDNIGIPHITVNSPTSESSLPHPPSPLPPPTSPPPHHQNGTSKQRSEGKENNPAPQERKRSCTSDVVAESIPLIPFLELATATHDWDKKTIIGKGGFGTVFKGNWKNTLVAIKRIEQRGAESTASHQAQMEQLLQELRILNSCRHDNILPLYGFSMDGVDPCLVYQFMPNGSLEDRLLCRQGTPTLSWIQRHNIARGTARGLQFLHGKPFIHGDIKSANILLDKNFEPRIGDFGLARDGPQGHYTHMKISRIHGTLAYLPIDFLRNKQLSTKVDTYSFGVVVFELATGLRAYDEKRPQKLLKDFVLEKEPEDIFKLHDQKPGIVNSFIFRYMIELGSRCVHSLARERPEMEEVLKHLDILNFNLSGGAHFLAPNTPSDPFGRSLSPGLQVAFVVTEPPNASGMPVPGPFPCRQKLASPVSIPVCQPPDGHVYVPDLDLAESHSSDTSLEESGAALSPSILPSNAVVPLLSALGTADSGDHRDSSPSHFSSSRNSEKQSTHSTSRRPPEITAKGKPLLCGDLSN